VYGTLGVGINTAFVEEVQIKTGGFEPQYGQSQGGIVNIITRSGGREWRGSVSGFLQPGSLESTREQRDDTRVNKVG
jgi:outer membrane receptor for ferrienterochelin and colicin